MRLNFLALIFEVRVRIKWIVFITFNLITIIKVNLTEKSFNSFI